MWEEDLLRIIDEEALIDALQDGTIKGAGLDVMTVEPLPKDSYS